MKKKVVEVDVRSLEVDCLLVEDELDDRSSDGRSSSIDLVFSIFTFYFLVLSRDPKKHEVTYCTVHTHYCDT